MLAREKPSRLIFKRAVKAEAEEEVAVLQGAFKAGGTGVIIDPMWPPAAAGASAAAAAEAAAAAAAPAAAPAAATPTNEEEDGTVFTTFTVLAAGGGIRPPTAIAFDHLDGDEWPANVRISEPGLISEPGGGGGGEGAAAAAGGGAGAAEAVVCTWDVRAELTAHDLARMAEGVTKAQAKAAAAAGGGGGGGGGSAAVETAAADVVAAAASVDVDMAGGSAAAAAAAAAPTGSGGGSAAVGGTCATCANYDEPGFLTGLEFDWQPAAGGGEGEEPGGPRRAVIGDFDDGECAYTVEYQGGDTATSAHAAVLAAFHQSHSAGPAAAAGEPAAAATTAAAAGAPSTPSSAARGASKRGGRRASTAGSPAARSLELLAGHVLLQFRKPLEATGSTAMATLSHSDAPHYRLLRVVKFAPISAPAAGAAAAASGGGDDGSGTSSASTGSSSSVGGGGGGMVRGDRVRYELVPGAGPFRVKPSPGSATLEVAVPLASLTSGYYTVGCGVWVDERACGGCFGLEDRRSCDKCGCDVCGVKVDAAARGVDGDGVPADERERATAHFECQGYVTSATDGGICARTVCLRCTPRLRWRLTLNRKTGPHAGAADIAQHDFRANVFQPAQAHFVRPGDAQAEAEALRALTQELAAASQPPAADGAKPTDGGGAAGAKKRRRVSMAAGVGADASDSDATAGGGGGGGGGDSAGAGAAAAASSSSSSSSASSSVAAPRGKPSRAAASAAKSKLRLSAAEAAGGGGDDTEAEEQDDGDDDDADEEDDGDDDDGDDDDDDEDGARAAVSGKKRKRGAASPTAAGGKAKQGPRARRARINAPAASAGIVGRGVTFAEFRCAMSARYADDTHFVCGRCEVVEGAVMKARERAAEDRIRSLAANTSQAKGSGASNSASVGKIEGVATTLGAIYRECAGRVGGARARKGGGGGGGGGISAGWAHAAANLRPPSRLCSPRSPPPPPSPQTMAAASTQARSSPAAPPHATCTRRP